MEAMFEESSSLVSLNLNNFNTSKVTPMHNMFYRCNSLLSLNLNNFHFSEDCDTSFMFENNNKNLVICINETIFQNSFNLTINGDKICYINSYSICFEDICPKNYSKFIKGKKYV